MKPLRILQISNRIPWPLNDGGNIATYNVARYLHRQGHSVTLASLNTLKHRQDPSQLKEIDAIHSVEIDTSISILGLIKGIFSAEPYNVSRFKSLAFENLLLDLLEKESFDLVQLEGSYMSLYCDTIRKKTSVPIVLRSHNVEFKIWNRLANAEQSKLKSWYLKLLGKKIERFEIDHLDDYDAIVPIADLDEEFYRSKQFSKPMRTVNGGVDLERFAPVSTISADTKFLFLGSLEWQPNIQGLYWFLENVWPKIYQKHPNTSFHVAGKNPSKALAELKVEGMVFHGMVDDAAEFLKSGHFLVVPLHSGGGMRLKIVEALANAKCIISTSLGAEGIAINDGKNIVLADSPQTWIEKMDYYLQHPEESVAIAQNALQLAHDKYGWDAIVSDLVDFYRTEVLK